MRINNLSGNIDQSSVESAKKAAPQGPQSSAQGAGEQAAAHSGEKVTLSSQAQQLAANAENAKVQKLQSAIQDGSFKIDPHAIAKRLVDGG